MHCAKEYPHCQQKVNVAKTVSFDSNEENKIEEVRYCFADHWKHWFAWTEK